jgi:hypothetical protein
MNTRVLKPDPAAIFGCALSLYNECREAEKRNENMSLSDCYSGLDGLMRVVMHVATSFEGWACEHISFDELDDVWPYILEDHFGKACLDLIDVERLTDLDTGDWHAIALIMRLPILRKSRAVF